MTERPRSLPGQLDNCELCGKRFTVTAYSKTGPNGGFLCPKCSKEVGNDEKKKAKPKKREPRSGRRQVQSSLLDGVVQHGTISLVETCTKVFPVYFCRAAMMPCCHAAMLAGLNTLLTLSRK